MPMQRVRRLFAEVKFRLVEASAVWIAVAFVLASGGYVLLKARQSEVSREPSVAEYATITSLSGRVSRFGPARFGVEAQDQTGLLGRIGASPERVAGCKPGDKILVERRGVGLTLHPAPCPLDTAISPSIAVANLRGAP